MADDDKTDDAKDDKTDDAKDDAKDTAASAGKGTRGGSSAKKVARKTRAKASARRGKSGSTDAEDADVTSIFAGYMENVTSLQSGARTKYVQVLQKYVEEVSELQSDLFSADPTGAFLSDVMRAYRDGDQQGVQDAYASLNNHAAQTRSTFEKRYAELTAACQKTLAELSSRYGEDVLEECRDYSGLIASAVKEIDPKSLDPVAQSILAHGLVMSSMVQSPT